MNKRFVFYLVGNILLLVAPLLAFCGIIGRVESGSWNAPAARSFIVPFFLMAVLGVTLSGTLRRYRASLLLRRDGIGIVIFSWLGVCFFGAMPFYFFGATPAQAFFESVSGFTTTGSSIYVDIDSLPNSILAWRSLTQWVGGLGILVFLVALLTKLGIRGRALLGAESSVNIGASATSKIKDLASNLLVVYLILTGGCFLSLLLVGILSPGSITLSEALHYSLTTVSTGGFAPHSKSVAHFDNALIETIIIVFVLTSSLSFVLLYRVFGSGDWGPQAGRAEAVTFLAIVGLAIGAVTFNLVLSQNIPILSAFRQACFPIASMASSAGFGTTDYDQWPLFSRIVIGITMILGGCGGSTSGGLKVIRFLLILKILSMELRKTFRPRLVAAIRLDGRSIAETHQYRVLMYMVTYGFLVILSSGLVSLMEPGITDFQSAMGAVLATFNNMGPGFGDFGPTDNFSSLRSDTLLFLSWLMLLGRLEIFVLLALLSPSLWKA